MNHKKSAARVLTPEPGGAIRRPSQLVLARLSKLARTQKGQIAAIEMGSQEIFIGKDVVEATLKGWKKYPGQSFYFVRIGYPAVHRHRVRQRASLLKLLRSDQVKRFLVCVNEKELRFRVADPGVRAGAAA